jgi:hypothetical protein
MVFTLSSSGQWNFGGIRSDTADDIICEMVSSYFWVYVHTLYGLQPRQTNLNAIRVLWIKIIFVWFL